MAHVRALLRRTGLLGLVVPHWVRTAWWGIVGARVGAPVEVAQAVVLREGRVLLALRRDVRGWELPGGNLLPGEPPEAGLRREVFEETGLEVEIERLTGTYRRSGFLPHRARVYRCRVLGGELRPSDETPRVAWFPAGALPAGLLPWCRAPLADALGAASEPVERSERQGLRQIADAAHIDLRARLRGD